MPARASRTPGATENTPAAPHYRAFISYSHTDATWARWLRRRLENYRVPARFHGLAAPIGAVGARIAPVFRDRDELPTASDLGETIRGALRESATLVVICSPTAARSHWVREEILAFKRLHGEERVFALIVGGDPLAEGTAEDCFSPALRFALGADGQLSTSPAEPIAADARSRGDGKADAFLRLIAGLLGVGFDDLRQRDRHRRHWRMTLITAGITLGLAVLLGLVVLTRQARNEAEQARRDAQRWQEQAERSLGFMIVDLRKHRDTPREISALENVGERAMMYVTSLKARHLDDTTLGVRVKALTVLGVARVRQLRYEEARQALVEAFDLATAITSRHPQDENALFDRSQVEYYLGELCYHRGLYQAATGWFTRYRDSSTGLVALDPQRSDWQEELAYGYHNIAAIEEKRGQLDAARRGFLAELELLSRVLPKRPHDLKLRFRAIDATSWLGTIAERSGDLHTAKARFAEQVAQVRAIADSDSSADAWREKLGKAYGLHAGLLAITGDLPAALDCRQRARDLYGALVAVDPRNRACQIRVEYHRLAEAQLRRAQGDLAAAARLIEDTRRKLEAHWKAEPSEAMLADRLVTARRLHAELLEATGQPNAREVVASAIELGETKVQPAEARDEIVGQTALALLFASRLAAQSGEPAIASQHLRRALELVEARSVHSHNWQILDPAARAYALAGNRAGQRAVRDRLDKMGYQPLDPWPWPKPN